MMTAEDSPRARFVNALLEVGNGDDRSSDELATQVRSALLEFGSQTEDNVSCAERTSVLEPTGTEAVPARGLAVGEQGILLADLLNFAEGCDIPEEVRDRYPDLEQDDWDAALRLTTLIVTALQRYRTRGQ